ncbi:unnamed protein product [Musa acuminata var. zebrina]
MTPLVLHFLLVFSTTVASNYDYFRLWPGSYCNVNHCYPMSTGNPKFFFTIYGLWPAFSNVTFPSCNKNMSSASNYNRSHVCSVLTQTTIF